MSKHRRRRAAAIVFVMVVLTFSLTHDSHRVPSGAAKHSTSGARSEATGARHAPPPRAAQLLPDASVSQPSMWLRGRVVSARTGLGIPAATLVILRQGRAEAIQSTTTGDFEFAPPRPGDYAIVGASHPDFQPFAPVHGSDGMHFHFEPGTSFTNVTIVLAPLLFCEGIVRDEQERPVPRAKVHIVSTGRWDPASAPAQRTFETDDTGRFRIPLIPDALIQAEAGQAHSQVECLCPITECPLQLDVSNTTPPANLLYIEGAVLDPRGNPIPDIHVSATGAGLRRAREDNEPPINDGGIDEELLSMILETGTRDEAITDDDGHFAIGPLENESYDVYISTTPEAAVTVEAGTRGVVLVLPDTGRIRGHVFAEDDGTPVTRFSFEVEKYRSNGELAWGRLKDSFRRRGTLHDATGAFEFRNLVPGRYRLHMAAVGFASSTQTVTVNTGETLRLTFALKRAMPLRGVVTDAETGRPMSGAVIAAWKATGAGDWYEAMEMSTVSTHPLLARTSADGSFELASGGEPLWVSHEGYNAWVLRESPRPDHVLRIALSPRKAGQPSVEEYGGVGIAYARAPGRDDAWVVQQVLEGSPSERAGIATGDLLLAVDDLPAIGVELMRVIERVRGEPGTRVHLRFSSAHTGREYDAVLTRARLPE